MWLQDGGSSHQPMCWVPGGFPRLLSGLSAGGSKGASSKAGPSALFKQDRRVWAEFTLQQTHWEAVGWRRRRTISSTWYLFSIPPQNSWKHRVASTSLQFHAALLVFRLYQWSLLHVTQKKPNYKSEVKTLPKYKALPKHNCFIFL